MSTRLALAAALTVAVAAALVVLAMMTTTWITYRGDLYVNQSLTYNRSYVYVNGSMIWTGYGYALNAYSSWINIAGKINITKYSMTFYPDSMLVVRGVVASGSLASLTRLDNVYLVIAAANVSKRFIAVLDLNRTLPAFVKPDLVSSVVITVCGNTSIYPNTRASISLYDWTASKFVDVAKLNSTSRTSVVVTVSRAYVAPDGKIWMRINMTDTRNTPYSLALDYVEIKPIYYTGGIIKLNKTMIVLAGGVINNTKIYLNKTYLKTIQPLILYNTMLSAYESKIEGNVTLMRGSTASLTKTSSELMKCVNCSSMMNRYESEMTKDIRIYMNTTLAWIRKAMEKALSGHETIELEVTTPGVVLELDITTKYCKDNMTVIKLPNGTIINVPSCRIKMKLKLETKAGALEIYHGYYNPYYKMLLHVNNANITSYKIMPTVGTLLNVTITAPKGSRSTVMLTNLTATPYRIFVDGNDTSWLKVSPADLTNCTYKACWTYVPENSTVYVNVLHSSPVTVVVYSAQPRFDAWAEDGRLYVKVYNPYDYDWTVTMKYYAYMGKTVVEEGSTVVTIPARSEYVKELTITKSFTSVEVRVYDQGGGLLWTKTISVLVIPLQYVVLAVVAIAVIAIALIILMRAKRKAVEAREIEYA